MELKTLKDLKESVLPRCMPDGQHDLNNFSEELKEEAIRDIKVISKMFSDDFSENKIGDLTISHTPDELCSIINYIKWKFNITEEDLK